MTQDQQELLTLFVEQIGEFVCTGKVDETTSAAHDIPPRSVIRNEKGEVISLYALSFLEPGDRVVLRDGKAEIEKATK